MGFNLTQIINKNPIKVDDGQNISPFYFGPEKTITPNYPMISGNTWYIGSSYRHKQFGSICVGRNNVAYMVCRVSVAHGGALSGPSGGIYWCYSYDEGETWSDPIKFTQEEVINPIEEDLRDITLTYDDLIDKYFLIFAHQKGIRNQGEDYSHIEWRLKVFIGDEPFVNMIDISPGILPVDGSTFDDGYNRCMQTFEHMHRIGSYWYLPVYTDMGTGERISGSSLLRFKYNDTIPLSEGVKYMSWNIIKDWELNGDNETTLYITYNQNGAPRLNMLSRKNDMGYLTYSDDMGETWTDKESIGIEVAGGPGVFSVNDGFMLVAREQTLDGAATVFAMFSQDGYNWKNKIKIGNSSSSYASIAKFKSGKTLLCYGQEYSHTGIQVVRQIFNTPL